MRRRPVAVAALLAVVLLLGYGSVAYQEGHVPFAPRDDQWSGVFLTNGQAYFGHFYSGPGEYARLRDVYYVLATQLQSQDPNVAAQTQLTLQRLGGEIHGPTQEMRISKQQILFTEELRADSAVVTTIAQLRSGAVPQQQPQATQRPAATTAAPVTQAPATQAPATQAPATRSPSPSPTRSSRLSRTWAK